MEYTKKNWEVVHYTNPDDNAVKCNDKLVAGRIVNDDDAHLIIAAVNACAEVNPDNPLAVAEAIKPMYKALIAIQQYLFCIAPEGTKLTAMIDEALALADRKTP